MRTTIPKLVRFLVVLVGLWLILALCGCTETRTEKQADTEKRDTFTVRGDAAVPMPQGGTALIPVEFTVERVGSERLVEHSESRTQIDSAAIAQQIGAVVGKTLDAAVAKMTGLQPKAPSGGGIDLLGLLGGTGGAAATAYALREALARRRLEIEHAEVKADRDKGWDEAMTLAKRIRPEDAERKA